MKTKLDKMNSISNSCELQILTKRKLNSIISDAQLLAANGFHYLLEAILAARERERRGGGLYCYTHSNGSS